MTRQLFFRLFYSIVQAMPFYAAELWKLLQDDRPVESVLLVTCKTFLNFPIHIPSDMVSGKLRCHPLFVNCCIKTIENRLPKQAYLLLYSLDAQGK